MPASPAVQHFIVDALDRGACNACEQGGQHGVQEAGKTRADEHQTMATRTREMPAVGFTGLRRMFREGIVHNRPLPPPPPKRPGPARPPAGPAARSLNLRRDAVPLNTATGPSGRR